MTETQGWFIVVAVCVIALYYIIAIVRNRP